MENISKIRGRKWLPKMVAILMVRAVTLGKGLPPPFLWYNWKILAECPGTLVEIGNKKFFKKGIDIAAKLCYNIYIR